jgi:osmotically-inducible protein OsmY
MKPIGYLAVSVCLVIGLAGCESWPFTQRSDSGTSRSKATVDDATLTSRVNTALARDVPIPQPATVNVTTANGVVTLTGMVDSEATKQRAEIAAKKVDGVKSVQNNIGVRGATTRQ